MQLAIFPERSFEHSLLTVVLVGLYVRFALTEWLGWGVSGLVVPGYLAAIAVVRPVSVVVVVVEAVATLLVVRAAAWTLSRTRLGTPPFGRDRFIWIVVASIGVRIFVEGVLAPLLQSELREQLGFDVTAGHGFFGVGLVLVPLLANSCWKPGVWRGMVQAAVTTGITYVILRGLLETTNFSLASVTLSFERLALDFSASPKAYILLLATALVASRLNLRYGWDTSGVMIPGLIGLGWFDPARVLGTVGETLIIVVTAMLFVRLPRVRDWNIEGLRRIVLVFTLDFVIKLVLVYQLAWTSFRATDLFGIGYLLPGLLAVKVWQRRNPAVVLLPALQVSVIGLALGTIAGFGLTKLDAALGSRQPTRVTSERCASPDRIQRTLWLGRARLAMTRPSERAPKINPDELRRFDALVRAVSRGRGATSCDALGLAAEAQALGLALFETSADRVGGSYFVLAERATNADEVRGFGTIAIPRGASSGPTLVATRLDEESFDADVLLELATTIHAQAIVVDGLARSGFQRGDTSADANAPVRIAAGAIDGSSLVVHLSGALPARWSGQIASTVRTAVETRLGAIPHDGAGSWAAELRLSDREVVRLVADRRPRITTMAGRGAWLEEVRAEAAPALDPLSQTLLVDDVVRKLSQAPATASAVAVATSVASAATEAGYVTTTLAASPSTIAVAHRGGLHVGGGMVVDLAGDPGWIVEVASDHAGAWELGDALARQLRARTFVVANGTMPDGVRFATAVRTVTALAVSPPRYLRVTIDNALASGMQLRVRRDRDGSSRRAMTTLGRELGFAFEIDDAAILPDEPGLAGTLFDKIATGPALWLRLSPLAAERFRPILVHPAEQALLGRLGIAPEPTDLVELLAGTCAEPGGAPPLSVALVDAARAYASERNPGLLPALAADLWREQARGSVVFDATRASTHLVLAIGGSKAAVALGGTGEAVEVSCSATPRQAITRALDGRAAVIRVRGAR